MNDAEILSLFKTFYNLLAYVSISDIDTDAKPELKNPAFSAVYHLTSGEDKKIDLVPTDGDKCYVFLDDEYTGTLAELSFLDSGNASVIPAYKTFCEHAGITPNTK